MTSKSKSWRDVLPIHPAAELFPMMTADELKALGTDIKKNGLREGVSMFEGALLDGRNRLDAMELAGIKLVTGNGQIEWANIQCRDVGRVDPVTFVISKNIHRRHLTAEQKRELVTKLIKATPKKSDRQIAKETDSNPNTVSRERKKLEKTGDVSRSDTRTDSKGRNQPAHKPSAKKPQAPAKPAAPEDLTEAKPPQAHKPPTKDSAVIAAADRAEARAHKANAEHVPHVEDEKPRASDRISTFVSDFKARIIDMMPLDADACRQLIAALREQINDLEMAVAAAPSSEPRKDDVGIPDFLRRTAP